MNNIEKEIRESYPFWSKLSSEQKEIVNNIAMQIPISCEDVAAIFTFYNSDRQEVIKYFKKKYGYIIS